MSDQIGMGQLDKDILQRPPSLSEFAHHPAPFDGKPEYLFAHIRTGFDSQ